MDGLVKYRLLKTAHRLAPVLISALIAAPWVAVPAQATVYQINQSGTTPITAPPPLSDTVSGSITTDGTLGILQTSNILSWNLDIIDNLNPAYDVLLTPANSGILEDIGNGLTASATGLSFNFSDTGAVFAIQGTQYGFFSGYQYFCFQATTGPCAAGETIVPYYYAVDGVEVTGLSGTLPLNPPSQVPEPATLSLFGGGLAALGIIRRKRGKRV
ncbi:MAG: PEP-CTERM sorting domain-containing protein [Stellaceae bacterium]